MKGVLTDIDKSIKATARTITRTNLKDKVRSEVVLHRAGLKSLTEAVSVTMATTIWKARKNMCTLGTIFEKKPSVRVTRSTYCENLCQPVPGYPELATNKLAQVWNFANLSRAKTLASARSSVHKWYQQNGKYLE